MNFFDLNDDVKSIIAKHSTSDFKIRTMLSSKHQDLQKYFLERLCSMMIFVKFQKHKMMLKKMMILKMPTYTRFIKI